MQDTIFVPLLLILISPAVGSFLNVLVDRLPRGESIVWPGSTCRSCATRLTLRDLVPVLSFAASGGRCRHCAAPIAPWHLYVELAATGLAVIATALGGTAAEMILTCMMLWVLLTLMASDLIWFRLPDMLTAPLAVLAFALAWLLPASALPGSAEMAALGALTGGASFWLLRQGYHWARGREGLGLGDVKLMVGLGALCGPWMLPHMLLLATLGALAATLVLHIGRGRPLSRTQPLPFGAALTAATAILWLLFRIPN